MYKCYAVMKFDEELKVWCLWQIIRSLDINFVNKCLAKYETSDPNGKYSIKETMTW